jgi:cytochrome c-type biogenesis protein CcmH/NrfF
MFGWIKRTVLWAAGIAALVLAAWMAGKREQKQQSAVKKAEGYAKTRKDIDHAETTTSDDPAVLRDFLRERGKQ